ncbi:hypothetical protein [Halobacillus naozhouensis]|uniref:Uncharacterized protein n=1 Tax=Halobacillus naozhouensis TaxID=554880 RepID=A0ABY8IV91_9BACI|nr:hypothetical protein [Halobacillus naozhouensis]WFT74088.1 hypothetical protein P9989_17195 [Halobacillus naozhouensis]
MALAVAGLNDICKARNDLEEIKRQHSELYEQLLHVVSLTRQLQLKYGYMGSLLMDEELPEYKPKFVRESVLRLYHCEVQTLKECSDIHVVKAFMTKHRKIGDSRIFLLILGAKPERLHGSTIMK